MNRRAQRAEAINNLPNGFKVVKDRLYLVRSQTDLNKSYFVKDTEMGLVCECLDHKTRKSDCKHIHVALKNIKKNVDVNEMPYKIPERREVHLCRYCDSGNIVKWGMRKKKNGKTQIFKCRDCKRKFSDNLGFERMRYDPDTIVRTMQMVYAKNSTWGISDSLEMEGINVSHVSVLNWIKKYSELLHDYVSTIKPRVSERWRTDELYVKFSGQPKWVYTMMDDSTRFMISQQISDKKYTEDVKPMFKNAEKLTDMKPHTLISDGAPNFHDAWKSEWEQKNPNQKMTSHIRHIHLAGDINNNKMERLNGSMRDWEQTRRGLKKMNSFLLRGYRTYYNYIKKHSGIDKKTPAEQALIHVSGINKWHTLIQNASMEKNRNGV